MKRRHLTFIIISLVLAMCLIGCASTSTGTDPIIAKSGKATTIYITKSAVLGDGSGLIPGTFTLPNGTIVSPGFVIQDGNWLYTAAIAKTQGSEPADFEVAAAEARIKSLEYFSQYLESIVSTTSNKSSTSSGENSSVSSKSDASIRGIEDVGFTYDGDGTANYLLRVDIKNVKGVTNTAEGGSVTAEKTSFDGFLRNVI